MSEVTPMRASSNHVGVLAGIRNGRPSCLSSISRSVARNSNNNGSMLPISHGLPHMAGLPNRIGIAWPTSAT